VRGIVSPSAVASLFSTCTVELIDPSSTMNISAKLLASCMVVQASVAARLGSSSHRSLQQSNDLPWVGPDLDISRSGLDTSSVIDTSGATRVFVSIDLSHKGSLETSGGSMDWIRFYFRIDSGPEEEWLYAIGEQYPSQAQAEIAVAAGSQLTLRTTGDTSAGSEAYFLRDFRVIFPLQLLYLHLLNPPLPQARHR